MFDGVTKYFKFTVLPFGLSLWDHIFFSKVMRPLVKYWRSKAITIVVYLDDGISAAANFSKCQGNSLLVRSELSKSGFVANKISVSGFPFRSFVGWVFFGISKQPYVYTTGEDFRDPRRRC